MVNQREKRERLPVEGLLLEAAGDAILDWWRRGYLEETTALLFRSFGDEARASLPALAGSIDPPAPDEVFAALRLQRLRLRHNQQVPEWARVSDDARFP